MNAQDLNTYLIELEELTNIESPTNHIDGINKVAEWFIHKANAMGLKHKSIAMNSSEVANCLFISNNLDATTFDLLFLAHMDTVFPVGSILKSPFYRNGNVINALGIIDDKGGALLSLYVIKELDLSRINIGIYLNSHEETGSEFSNDSIEEYSKKSKYCLVMEPARPDGSMVETRKGYLVYLINFKGIASHAGNAPDKGRSAVVEAARVIVEISKLTDYKRGHTFNSIITKGGVARNIIPDFASIEIEMRYVDQSSVKYFEKKLQEILSNSIINGVTYEKTLISSKHPMSGDINNQGEGHKNNKTMKEIFNDVGREQGLILSWVNAGGISDGNISSEFCPTIDGLGPTGGNMHTMAEYLEVDSVIPKCNLIVSFIKKLLAL